MRNATAKRLRFVIVPDHYEPLGRLDGAALGADGIMFHRSGSQDFQFRL